MLPAAIGRHDCNAGGAVHRHACAGRLRPVLLKPKSCATPSERCARKSKGIVSSALGTGAEMVGDGDENDGDHENQSGNRVDLGGDAAAQTAPDFERQSVVATVEKKGDGNFVHGKRED